MDRSYTRRVPEGDWRGAESKLKKKEVQRMVDRRQVIHNPATCRPFPRPTDN